MPNKLLIPISSKADLVVTHDDQIAIAPGVASNAQEAIEIGPLNNEAIEQLIFAVQRMRIQACLSNRRNLRHASCSFGVRSADCI